MLVFLSSLNSWSGLMKVIPIWFPKLLTCRKTSPSPYFYGKRTVLTFKVWVRWLPYCRALEKLGLKPDESDRKFDSELWRIMELSDNLCCSVYLSLDLKIWWSLNSCRPQRKFYSQLSLHPLDVHWAGEHPRVSERRGQYCSASICLIPTDY